MLEFKGFTLDDYKIVTEFREQSELKTCELTAGALFMWGDFYKPSYAIYNQTLIIKTNNSEKECRFFYPIGKDEQGALAAIEEYASASGLDLVFVGVEDFWANKLKDRYNGFTQDTFSRTWSDYIYSATAFAEFKGKKYSGQRNHINKFLSLYPNAVVKKFTEDDTARALKVIDQYAEEKGLNDKMSLREYNKAIEGTKNFKALGFDGIYVEVDGEMISFTLGEKCGKTQVIHIEKGLRRYEGVYPFTANAYAKKLVSKVEFLNREDDSGDAGLRKSKMQYQPIELLNKHIVKVIQPEKRLNYPPTLYVNGLVLNAFNEGDKQDYYRLYTDEQLNMLWGYDYKDDIKDPTPQAFYDMLEKDFANKTSVSLAVRYGKKLIGEAVFYNIKYGGECELGLRLFAEYHGMGYGTAIYKRVADFLLTELDMKTVKICCFKQNIPSQKAIERAGFIKIGEDEVKYYYKREQA